MFTLRNFVIAAAAAAATDLAAQPLIFDTIREEAYVRSQVAEPARFLCDRIGGRLTGTPAHRQAADAVQARLEALGLKVSLEALPIPNSWTRKAAVLRVTAPVQRRIPAVSAAFSASVAYAGKLSIDRGGEDAATLLPPGAAGAAKLPIAKAWLVDSGRPYGLLGTGGVGTSAPFAGPAAPAVFIPSHGAQLLRRLAEEGDVEIRLDVTNEVGDAAGEAFDVIADLKGRTAADRVVLCAAQLDSWDLGDGAVENAAACAVMIEAARILSRLEQKPLRTIRFAFLGGGCQGVGTSAYVSRRDENALLRHVAAFLIEPGGGRLLGLHLCEQIDALAVYEKWFEPVRDLGMTDIGYRASPTSMPGALQKAGVPAYAFVQEAPELGLVRGSPADTFDRLLPIDLQQAACVLATGLWTAANAKAGELPPRFRGR